MTVLKEAVTKTEVKYNNMEQRVRTLEDVFDQLDAEVDELQSIVDNTDNNAKKYNICL